MRIPIRSALFGLGKQPGRRLAVSLAGAALLAGTVATVSAAGTAAAGAANMVIKVPLTPQPVGTVKLGVATGGRLLASLNLAGVAPGTRHAVDIQAEGCNTLGAPTFSFPIVTASGTGQVVATVASRQPVSGTVPSSGALFVHLGASVSSPIAGLPIACANLAGWSARHPTLTFQSISDQTGPLKGKATLSYNASAMTLTVHAQACGLAPYCQHAAHIHLGSCAVQGSVHSMMSDLVANAAGDVNEVATFTGVTSPPPATGWYLNLHLGNSNQIAINGVPTILFRPLLCGDIVAP